MPERRQRSSTKPDSLDTPVCVSGSRAKPAWFSVWETAIAVVGAFGDEASND